MGPSEWYRGLQLPSCRDLAGLPPTPSAPRLPSTPPAGARTVLGRASLSCVSRRQGERQGPALGD